jgi:hypothetical protein
VGGATAEPAAKTRQPIIQNPQSTPTAELLPTEEATAVPPAQAAVRVVTASANLRRGPGTIYPTTGVVYAGQEARVVATNGDRSWYNVEFPDGARAWLAASVVEPIDAAAFNNVPVAATIPAAPTYTPVPPTATRLPPTLAPLPSPSPFPTSDGGDGGGGDGGGGDGGGNGGGEPPPPPKYTAEPP